MYNIEEGVMSVCERERDCEPLNESRVSLRATSQVGLYTSLELNTSFCFGLSQLIR